MVVNTHIICDHDLLNDAFILNSAFFEHDTPFISISEQILVDFQEALENAIERRFSKRNLSVNLEFVVKYKGQPIALNYKDKLDWQLALLIDLHNVVFTTIKLRSQLIIFNKKIISQDEDSIIAYIRTFNYSDVPKILNGINSMRSEVKVFEKINLEYLENALQRLVSLGYVYYNHFLKEYSVTPLGYIYR